MNAQLWGNEVRPMPDVDVAMIVETEAGEATPVLRAADRRGLREIGAVRRALEERARRGSSLPEDLAGGTFALTYLGELEADGYTPAVRPPQAAILGVTGVAVRPFARKMGTDPQLVAWPTLTLTLSFDRRLAGGARAARFLQHLKRSIEQPFLWLLY